MNTLAKKLMIKPHKNWLFYNMPAGYIDLLSPLPEGVVVKYQPVPDAGFDGMQAFVKNSMELHAMLSDIAYLVLPDTVAWICYPKKSSGMESDMMMMSHWEVLAQYNLEVVAAVSIDTNWTAVRVRLIGMAKKSKMANADIKENQYSNYIDVENKMVTMPPDVIEALRYEPEAMQYYHSLAYSHRKEYILWIISAKQVKTRISRVAKMINLLIAKKKNPSEK
jgi:hypothetical protein